ncbi:MAG: type II toxin-antitoxin system prevent-host-death family antitoxin [Dehalococcoidia bacterium]
MITVGIRELRTRLSSYLRQVRSGEVITVTDRGKPVARLEGVSDDDPPESLKPLIASGTLIWKGRLKQLPRTFELMDVGDGKTMDDYIREQRG